VPEETAPEETITTFQPESRAVRAASSAEVNSTGSGPVPRVTELDPSFTTKVRMIGF
jgi:hypothetical protein